jgi:hypothetical protein
MSEPKQLFSASLVQDAAVHQTVVVDTTLAAAAR